MKAKYLSQPCRNYCILQSMHLPIDPKDGREKYILSTFAAGGTGRIILIDAETEESETLELRGDEGAYGLYFMEDYESLLVGTCQRFGYIHRLDLKTRTWAKPLQVEGQTYNWDFARGKDGLLYGSNYPNCSLIQYNPKTHVLTSVGRVGNNLGNMYSRNTSTHPDGNIVIGASRACYEVYYYDIDQKTFTQIGVTGDDLVEVTRDYIMVNNHNDHTYRFYDPFSLELKEEPIDEKALDTSKVKNQAVLEKLESLKNPPYIDRIPGNAGSLFQKMSNGKVFGIQGQELIVIDGDRVELKQIPAEPPATSILTLAMDEDGILWGSSGFGQTIFHYNSKSGEYVNTVQVTKNGGEVYGICPKDGKIFLAAYAGGDHVVYDPKQPWNQHDNINPKTLEPVRPEMVRPHAKSVIGPDGNFFSGWSAAYGTYGGGISRINTKTYEMKSWYPMIPEQSMESIASSKEFLYAVTCGTGNGLAYRKDRFHILKLDCDCNILWDKQCDLGITFSKVLATGGYVFVGFRDENQNCTGMYVFREDTMEELSAIDFTAFGVKAIQEMIAYGEGTILVCGGNQIFLVQIPDGAILEKCSVDGEWIRSMVKGKEGEVYFSLYPGTEVYRLEI